ncbi:MAG: glycosyltransferase family 4 protein [Phycisphaerales bacterium]|nr:glycosyltransferase family 4 protein [Phycisphaerales bacterium]
MIICHIITRLIVGGAQENTLLTCVGLAERGHKVYLLTGPDAGPEGSLLAMADQAPYRLVVIPSLHRALRPLADWRALGELTRILRELNPHIVHTHSSKAGILGRLAARKAGVPKIVHSIHGMSFNRTQRFFTRWFYAALERYCARFSDKLIGVADAMAHQSVAAGVAGADKFVTVYSGMLTEWYQPSRYDRAAVRRAWAVGPDDIVVGTVARLFTNKGYEVLIPAMVEVLKRMPNLFFVWVGDGAMRAEYERRLTSAGIRGRVHLTGLVPPERVAESLAGMDMLVHASQWEGLPRAAVQALLMEKPVISFDIDGAGEVVVPDRTGVLVPLNDVHRLAGAIVELAADPVRREHFGRTGREECLRRFDHRVMVEKIDELYQELLAT